MVFAFYVNTIKGLFRPIPYDDDLVFMFVIGMKGMIWWTTGFFYEAFIYYR